MKQLPPLYILPHGILVVGEYPAKGKNRYARLRIRPHPFFPDAPATSNGILVRKNRVILSSKLGRILLSSEHAHHIDENELNDSPSNIELRTAAEHNRLHKTGKRNNPESNKKTKATLKRLYAEGKMISNLVHKSGHENPYAKLTFEQVKEIRSSVGTHQKIADRFGVSRRNIGMIKNGVTWK